MKRFPKFLKKYFWDVDFDVMDAEKNRANVLVRILNYGDEKAVQWMNENFSKAEQAGVLRAYRDFSLKSANFWALILAVPKEKVLCLKMRSSKGQKPIWPY